MHPSYSPLHYVLFFPDGRDGWHTEIPLNGFILDENAAFVNDGEQAIVGKGGSKRMTQMQFYAYMLQIREGEHWIFRAGWLLQQYLADAYACVKQNQLKYIRGHQKDLRCELYRRLQDALEARDVDAAQVGQNFLLPSIFSGGPC